ATCARGTNSSTGYWVSWAACRARCRSGAPTSTVLTASWCYRKLEPRMGPRRHAVCALLLCSAITTHVREDEMTRTTTDHNEIRKWAEDRGARPARVKGTGTE